MHIDDTTSGSSSTILSQIGDPITLQQGVSSGILIESNIIEYKLHVDRRNIS